MEEGDSKSSMDAFARRSQYVKMAMGSWLCPLIAWMSQVFLNLMINGNLAKPKAEGFYLFALLQLILIMAGGVLGIRALKGIKEHRAERNTDPGDGGDCTFSDYIRANHNRCSRSDFTS